MGGPDDRSVWCACGSFGADFAAPAPVRDRLCEAGLFRRVICFMRFIYADGSKLNRGDCRCVHLGTLIAGGGCCFLRLRDVLGPTGICAAAIRVDHDHIVRSRPSLPRVAAISDPAAASAKVHGLIPIYAQLGDPMEIALGKARRALFWAWGCTIVALYLLSA